MVRNEIKSERSAEIKSSRLGSSTACEHTCNIYKRHIMKGYPADGYIGG